MLHVLRLVHANGQFDLQIIWTTFGDGHLVELGLLRTVGSGMEHHLEAEARQRTKWAEDRCVCVPDP